MLCCECFCKFCFSEYENVFVDITVNIFCTLSLQMKDQGKKKIRSCLKDLKKVCFGGILGNISVIV